MVRAADRVITCSAYMREHVADAFGIAADRITVIPNGIDPTDLQPMADLPRLRARFAAPDEKLVLLVGRLVYEKGFHLALEAMPQLIERVGKVRFLVAGTGTAEAELKAQARELGLEEHGTFVGWTGDELLHSLYRIADLCLVPSIYEPFGLVALEAMASGCPCIVADTGGLREVVPAGRRVGLRFRARDSRSLARMAEELLADDALRERLVAQASEHVLRFDWADVARQTAAVYDSPARRAARPPRRRGRAARRDPRAAQERPRARRPARAARSARRPPSAPTARRRTPRRPARCRRARRARPARRPRRSAARPRARARARRRRSPPRRRRRAARPGRRGGSRRGRSGRPRPARRAAAAVASATTGRAAATTASGPIVRMAAKSRRGCSRPPAAPCRKPGHGGDREEEAQAQVPGRQEEEARRRQEEARQGQEVQAQAQAEAEAGARRPRPSTRAPVVTAPPVPPPPPPPRLKVIKSPIAVYGGAFGRKQAERLAWRAGFGPRPGQLDALVGDGPRGRGDGLHAPDRRGAARRARADARRHEPDRAGPRRGRGACTGSTAWCAPATSWWSGSRSSSTTGGRRAATASPTTPRCSSRSTSSARTGSARSAP